MASPLQTVSSQHKDKTSLVKAVRALATGDLWVDRTSSKKGLEHVSNAKLLRLHRVLTDVKGKFGSRAKLIDAIVQAEGRAKDKDYRASFESLSTPRLWDCYRATEIRTKRASKQASAKPAAKVPAKKPAAKNTSAK